MPVKPYKTDVRKDGDDVVNHQDINFCINMSFIKSLVLFTSVALALPTSSIEARAADNSVEGIPGRFQKHVKYSFTGSSLPSGLFASGDLIKDTNNGAPFDHKYDASNVIVRNGFLELRVPGGQKGPVITSAEVFTGDKNILYGSVRTKAIFSTVPGTVQSSFFYKTDNQEADIEFLSAPESKANAGDGASIHYTNQAINGGGSTTSHGPAPANVGTAVHEYRLDWTKSYTAFYLDGVLQKKYTVNVPNVAGTWLWNNWANGDIQWSAGPPARDSVMKIQSVEMFYNTTGAV